MVSFGALGAAFGLVALGELGDKTELLVISLAGRHPRVSVFAGAWAAEIVMSGIAVAIGLILVQTLPLQPIQVAAGVGFIALGAYGLWRREREEAMAPPMDRRRAFASTFALVALGEVGDKTQLATVALAASTAAPGEVFVGACAALGLMMALAVFIGDRLARFLAKRTMDRLGAALFVVAGVLVLVDALFFP